MREFIFIFLLFLSHLLFAGGVKTAPFHSERGPGGEVFKFIENKGQWNPKVLFRADISAGALFLEKNCFTYSFYDNSSLARMHLGHILPESEWKIKFHAFRVLFVNSSAYVKISGSNPSPEYYNYFIGNDRSKWVSGAKPFSKISYSNLYKNIDLNLYTDKGLLKYDFVISLSGNPSEIKLDYRGTEKVFIRKGELIIKTSLNEIIEQKPYAYQVINGKKKEIQCAFVWTSSQSGRVGEGFVTFSVGQYDKSHPLIIDPTLIFASYSGSTADNFGMTATYDNAGNFYAGGTAFNNGYPTTVGAYDVTFNNTTTGSTITDVVITKYNSAGSGLIYSTYLGGNGSETVHSLIVNEQDELYLYGVTSSTNFPLSSNAYDNSFGGGSALSFPQNGTGFNVGTDIYVTKFNAAGSALIGSTYIGGSGNDGINYNNTTTLYDSLQYNYGDQFRGEIMIDDLGNCYVASSTKSADFPIVNGFQNSLNGDQDAVVFKLNDDLSGLIWSSFLGGSSKDAAYSVKLDSVYNVYVAGGTSSSNFPAGPLSLNPTFLGGKTDGYVAKISGDGSQLLNATFIGTSAYDQCYFVELDEDANVYLVGQTLGNFPVTGGVYSNPSSPQFIIKLTNPLDAIIYSTVFGNGSLSKVNISPSAFLVDDCQNIYVSGWGASILQSTPLSGMAITPDAVFPNPPNGFDFYLFVLARNASALIYATYFGGPQSQEHVDGGTSRFDKRGVVYQSVCAGCGSNSDFPTTVGSWSQTNNSFNCNNGTFKFDFQIVPVASLTTSTSDCDSCTGTASASATGGILPYSFLWDSAAGNATSPSITGLCAGTYYLTVTDSVGCPSYNSVEIFDNSSLALTISSFADPSCADSCNGQAVAGPVGGAPPYGYSWSNSSTSPSNTGLCAGTYSITLSDANNCERFATVTISSPPPFYFSGAGYTDAICAGTCNGTAFVSVTGGSSPYSFLWSNAETTAGVTGLCPGTVSVTITDNNGCPVDTSFTISGPGVMSTTVSALAETCYNLCNGSGSVAVSGGTSPFSYLWSNGSAVQQSTGLCPGTYFVTVTDSNNCQKTDSIIVSQADFLISLSGADNSNCLNCNGTAAVSPAGGFTPYSYQWNDSSVSSSLSGLCAGTYSVTVTDSAGCDTVASVLINDPSNMNLTLTDSVDLLCNGVCTGAAVTQVSGGASPFTYQWSSGQATPSVSGLCAGNYSLTVTDANDCKRILQVEIAEPPLLAFSSLNSSEVNCYGNCNGAATANMTGGTSPYDYLWSNAQITQGISGLCAGNYVVTVTDSNGCLVDTSVAISQPGLLESSASSSPQFCFLNCDGSATVSVSGGTTGYTYAWSNGSDSSTATGVCPGNYFVTVTDANGCTILDTAVVDTSSFNPQTIVLSSDTNTIFEGESTTLHAFFDTSANFQWSPATGLSNVNSPDPVASPAVTTTYYFTVSSPSDPLCKYSDTITIYVIEQVCGEPDIFVPNAFTPNNDNYNDLVFVRGNYIRKMLFVIYDRWGEKVFETENQGNGWDGTFKGMKCDPGVFVYYLTITCTDEQEFFKKGNITLIR